ncbi:GlxA family transcriptional regulator [Phyllobacterium ifriqiyense]|uniref:GlxA family transcriptional regulator n=1 Tax=Phyllobacterium ifriqiyense TaxID=314238 RepID=UPI0033922BEB
MFIPIQPARCIGFLVFPGFQALDLSGPLAAFELANGVLGNSVYSMRTISEHGGHVTSSAGLSVITEKVTQFGYDTIVVTGGEGAPAIANEHSHQNVVRQLSKCARRMTSVCTGAFLLAGAGVLDGRRATTHWRYVADLQNAFPATRIERDHIYVRDGSVWSSAGVTAGIDLALALIEEDLGSEISKAVARDLVVYHRRIGEQSQFSEMLEMEPSSKRIARALAYASKHLREKLNVEVLARAASLSERQFARAFRTETGETPARAVERLRVEAARTRLEGCDETIEAIGAAVGFRDPETMRRAFIRIYGVPPQAVRRAARTRKNEPPGFAGDSNP